MVDAVRYDKSGAEPACAPYLLSVYQDLSGVHQLAGRLGELLSGEGGAAFTQLDTRLSSTLVVDAARLFGQAQLLQQRLRQALGVIS